MITLKIEAVNPIPPKVRVAIHRDLILETIDRRIAKLEKAAEKYPPGYLNRSDIDGQLNGLRYARRAVEGFLSEDLLDITYMVAPCQDNILEE